MLDAVTSSKTTGKSSKQSMALSQNPSKKSNTFLQRLCLWFGNRRKNLYRKWLKTICKLRTLIFIYFVGLSVWGFFWLWNTQQLYLARTPNRKDPVDFKINFTLKEIGGELLPLNFIFYYRGKTWYGSNIRLCS